MKIKNTPFIKFAFTVFLLLFSSTVKSQTVSPKPKFSVERGFYNESFSLTIDAETTAVIKYTLDGSDPRASTTALQQNSPAVIFISPDSTTGQRAKAPGVVVRASTGVSGLSVSEPVTHTYLFVNKASSLSPDGVKPGPNWPTPGLINGQDIDYGMSSVVLNDSRYKNLIGTALLSIPSYSIAIDLKYLFSTDSGIYVNAKSDGIGWERPASVELLNPDGTEGFQINCGLRIRGGWSRNGDNPKHAFRLFFRSEYGEGKLKYPLFGDEGTDEFDKLDLRTSQNYSWSYPGHLGAYNIMNRDVFSRDMQREMGQPYTRSRFCHLYINGVYWGLYQTQERGEARYAATYFGGNIEDYDVVKVDDGYVVGTTDGTMNAYTEIWNMSKTGFSANENYFKLEGRSADGLKNSTYKTLVDIDNLIDYMLVIFYTGNFDSPVSKFGSDNNPNNFYSIYNRNGNEGFKFLAHDAEHTLRTTSGEGPGIGLNENRVNLPAMNVTTLSKFQPQWLHYKLTSNAEYRTRFADHVYKHMFNEGVMTPGKSTALFIARANEIDTAIIAESARWGDTYSNPPRTKDDDWQKAVDDIVKNYFPYRTGIVINQLKSANLFPNITPPVFKNNNDTIKTNYIKVESGYQVKLINSNGATGQILYTVNGADPRAIGGGASSSAVEGGDTASISISSTTILNARILNGTTWSALHEVIFFTDDNIRDVKLTEIQYHPLDGDSGVSNSEYEFLELKNSGSAPVNLSLANFSDGISYAFPSNTIINPGEFLVLASNKIEFNKRYRFVPFGEYSGQLDNGGETITLVTATNDTIFSVTYDDESPWPVEPDGLGYSLVTKEINPTGDLNDASQWRASLYINGSPGADDILTSVKNPPPSAPVDFTLYQNYPNPFNPATEIRYQIPQASRVMLKIYDVIGREVATLVNGQQSPGEYKITWNANQFASGIYFYRLQTANRNFVKKMILMR